MPLSDIHFDLCIFSSVSVWATFVMHDTGPGRQSFSHIGCQIYIENYRVIISGTTGPCSSVLSGDITYSQVEFLVSALCLLFSIPKKRTCHFGYRICFSP